MNNQDSAQPHSVSGSFPDNPIVYFVIIDRFKRGSRAPRSCYGRTGDGADEIGTFHGGDFDGISEKLVSGWFTKLGVNAIWLTAPYEQIYGWVCGSNAEFKHYAYHGYWALDFTAVDCNFGDRDALRRMIDIAHSLQIRIIFDVVMNHPGYPDLMTLGTLLPHAVRDGYANAGLNDYDSFYASIPSTAQQQPSTHPFAQWWGGDWVRADLPGYPVPGTDDLTMQLAGLPDFCTESETYVKLPAFLRNKPGTTLHSLPNTTVRGYLVTWLSNWVREFGVDGFRCDSVKHVELASWQALKESATAALKEWKWVHPDKAIDDAPFWMTGEVFANGIERNRYYDHGFDNLINFQFQHEVSDIFHPPSAPAPSVALAFCKIDMLYRRYASALAGRPGYNVLSYISSHDTMLFPRETLLHAGSALLLVPGGVQIFYGDESSRPPGPFTSSEPVQATRSDMNWNTVDTVVLHHWRTIGCFRARHVALARGTHRKLNQFPYVFSRVDEITGDRVLVLIGTKAKITVQVASLFPDGAHLRDAYADIPLIVVGGTVTLTLDRIALLELDAHDTLTS